jgi:hypothetical protein
MSHSPVQKRSPRGISDWGVPLLAALGIGAVLWSWWFFGVFQPTPFDGDRWNACAGIDRSGVTLEGGYALLVSEETLPRYQEAALQGNATAQYQLGLMRQVGFLVVWDMAEVYKWFCVAAANGNRDALKAKIDLCRGISLDGVIEGRRRVAESGLLPPMTAAAAEYQAMFYRRYPDLQPHKNIVDAVADKMQAGAFRELTWARAAKEARLERQRH